MIKKQDKEKVIKILTSEEFNHMNAFNIIPNLSDKVIDYNERNFNFIDIIMKSLEEKESMIHHLKCHFLLWPECKQE